MFDDFTGGEIQTDETSIFIRRCGSPPSVTIVEVVSLTVWL
jgi:hypothetical protein